MILMGYTGTVGGSLNASKYYDNFVDVNMKTSKCAGMLMDANTYYVYLFSMVFSRNPDKVYNMSYQELYKYSYNCIVER
jgi:hypothetical protein